MKLLENELNDAVQDMLARHRQEINPETIRRARQWYMNFAGPHAVHMDDRELVEIFNNLS